MGALNYCHKSAGICHTACLCVGHIHHKGGKRDQFQSFKQGEENRAEEKANDSQ